jgi:hypothetical protein
MITFLGAQDYANIMTHWSHYLNQHTNYRSQVVCLRPHPFNYAVKHDYDLKKIANGRAKQELKRRIVSSSVFIIDDTLLGLEKKYHLDADSALSWILRHWFKIDVRLTGLQIGLWHPGSVYRRNHRLFNYQGYQRIITAPDLYHLSPIKSLTFTYYPIPDPISYDLQNIQDKINKKVILHLPSNPKNKGTVVIDQVVEQFISRNRQYRYIRQSGLPYRQVIALKQQSLIYIDLFSFPTGINSSFGLAGFEALLCGNVTLTSLNLDQETSDQLRRNLDLKDSRSPFVNIGTSIETFTSVLDDLGTKSDEDFEQMIRGSWEAANQMVDGKQFANKFVREILDPNTV